jgi:hypothetical protein
LLPMRALQTHDLAEKENVDLVGISEAGIPS